MVELTCSTNQNARYIFFFNIIVDVFLRCQSSVELDNITYAIMIIG